MRNHWTSFAASLSLKHLAMGLLVLIVIGVCGCAGVKWDFDYAKAQRQAQQCNQPILLYFWDWLSIDRSRMDSEVWNDPHVVAESRRVIVVPVEQGWFPDMVKKYEVTSAPTLVLLTPQGQEISRLKGVPTASELVNWLRSELARPATTRPAESQPATPPSGQAGE